ncbi:MAG TPA: IS630 family transposase [Intrasporangium sp.]|uniref:IS630 family transposase n=1 Tax=Intrasporangium sp. TaxID=1925024 RepID=UPI002D778376|nr:IS630 family transposase [Intrasporangium sp.]HET7398876.1 IS630 family transposase [Intrasporangium sp.]
MSGRVAKPLPMSDSERATLEQLSRSQTAPHRQVQRAKALLLAADGVANSRISEQVGVTRVTVRAWRARFVEDGLAKLGEVREGRGRRASIGEEQVRAIVHDTLHTTPEGETHWSCRTMAKHAGVSPATVQRIWHDLGIKPHRLDTFKVSNDPRFEEKLTDVVGLYLNPPEKAVVLCLDEKSQVQALDRTQPSLPMVKGRGATMTHDYKRHGTTTLFAALNVLTGEVTGRCFERHRNEEFLKFLKVIDAQVPKGQAIHVILDNYSTHKHEAVQRWLGTHKRFHLHFIPTSSSWLNQVERWFRDLDAKALRRGSFSSVPDLIAAIEDYLRAHNAEPTPFVWTATAESILAKVTRARRKLEEVVNH